MMGRGRIQVRRIEDPVTRQVKFSKRKGSLMKKAYELSVLCDIDLALMLFSPSGRPCYFSGKKRFEDVFERYINLPKEQKEGIQDVEYVSSILQKLRVEDDGFMHPNCVKNTKVESKKREISALEEEIREKERQLRFFEPNISKMTLEQIEIHEKFLIDYLDRLEQRAKKLEKEKKNPPLLENTTGQEEVPTANLLAGLEPNFSSLEQAEGATDAAAFAGEPKLREGLGKELGDHSIKNPVLPDMNSLPVWDQQNDPPEPPTPVDQNQLPLAKNNNEENKEVRKFAE